MCISDVITLRSKYRIVGKLICSHPNLSRHTQMLTRPMYLNHYETTLLLEKGKNLCFEIVKQIRLQSLQKEPFLCRFCTDWSSPLWNLSLGEQFLLVYCLYHPCDCVLMKLNFLFRVCMYCEGCAHFS